MILKIYTSTSAFDNILNDDFEISGGEVYCYILCNQFIFKPELIHYHLVAMEIFETLCSLPHRVCNYYCTIQTIEGVILRQNRGMRNNCLGKKHLFCIHYS